MTHPTVFSFLTAARRVAFAFLLPTLALAQYSSPVRDVENPAHSPLRIKLTLIEQAQFGFQLFTTVNAIPLGKRMVVEYISVTCRTMANEAAQVAELSFFAYDSTSMGLIAYALPVTKSTPQPFLGTRYFASQGVRLYADGANGPTIGAEMTLTASPQTDVTCDFVISGYTVNMP